MANTKAIQTYTLHILLAVLGLFIVITQSLASNQPSPSPALTLASLQLKPVTQENTLFHVQVIPEISLDIYVPATANDHYKLPVVYVMDGQHYLHNAIGYQTALRAGISDMNISPEFIVVGINTTKLVEQDTRNAVLNDQPDALADLLATQIVPYVEHHFPASPHRLYFGWQFGAMFGLTLFNQYPALMNGYLLASGPYYSQAQIAATKKILATRDDINPYFYLSLGKMERHAIDGHKALTEAFEQAEATNVTWKYNYFDRFSFRYDHFTTPLDTLTNGLEWYFADYADLVFYSVSDLKSFGGVEAVKQYFKNRASRYNISPKVGDVALFTMYRHAVEEDNLSLFQQLEQSLGKYEVTGWYHFFARFFLKHDMVERAIHTYLSGIAKKPGEFLYFAALAEIYQQQGKYKTALRYYNDALQRVDADSKEATSYREEIANLNHQLSERGNTP